MKIPILSREECNKLKVSRHTQKQICSNQQFSLNLGKSNSCTTWGYQSCQYIQKQQTSKQIINVNKYLPQEHNRKYSSNINEQGLNDNKLIKQQSQNQNIDVQYHNKNNKNQEELQQKQYLTKQEITINSQEFVDLEIQQLSSEFVCLQDDILQTDNKQISHDNQKNKSVFLLKQDNNELNSINGKNNNSKQNNQIKVGKIEQNQRELFQNAIQILEKQEDTQFIKEDLIFDEFQNIDKYNDFEEIKIGHVQNSNVKQSFKQLSFQI